MVQITAVAGTHVLLPLAMLALLLWRPSRNVFAWSMQAIALLGPLAVMYVGGSEWSLLSVYAREALLGVGILALAAGVFRHACKFPFRHSDGAFLVLFACLLRSGSSPSRLLRAVSRPTRDATASIQGPWITLTI
jgi:hypothetical protein